MRIVLALALGLAASGAAFARHGPTPPAGYVFPALSGRVVDRADLLPPTTEDALARALATAERETGHQFVVVTVPSLGGHRIEDYGRRLGNAWGIGRKGVDDGILLIVALGERKVRIEVGKGLQGVVRYDEAMAIIDTAILPRFRAGDLRGGILAGSAGIIREFAKEGTKR